MAGSDTTNAPFNEPAFPVLPPETNDYRGWPASPGMWLRDYFAAAALSGVLFARAQCGEDLNQESIADECYELADAMLAQRIKQPQEA
jgi:hypothetical protein